MTSPVQDAEAAPAEVFDVAVVGAGPAGLAAAGEAAAAGCSVLLVDAGTQFGGQYWRHATAEAGDTDPGRWHHGWSIYQRLAQRARDAVDAGLIRHLASTHVVSIRREQAGADGAEGFLLQASLLPEAQKHGSYQAPQLLQARALILCPGTYDRQLPVPGWTLPGVMAAGGVQAFIKTQGVAPGRRVVLAGTGPFLLSAAASVIHAGAEVAAICESNSLTGWFPGGAAAALVPSKAAEGAEYVALLAKHRVPYYRSTAVTAIHGDGAVRSVTVSALDASGTPVPGSGREVNDVDVVGLGWGFVPQPELLLQLGAQTTLGEDGSLVGVADADQLSSIPGLYLAGEITGVAGAAAAVAEGRIAGRAASSSVGQAVRTGGADIRDRATRAAHRRFAAVMHKAHPVPEGWTQWLEDETLICRCEEVPWETARVAAEELSAEEPRGLKGSTRIGMGWCQGRMCGFAAQCLSKKAHLHEGESSSGREAEHAAALSAAKRPLAVPMRLGDLAEEPELTQE